MRTNFWLMLWLTSWGCGTASWAAEGQVRPQGYRHVDFQKPYDRTYGGYWWIEPDGTLCEEGITVDGLPLIGSADIMLVMNAATGEASHLHFVDGDIRWTWAYGSRTTGLHLFSRLCPRDPLVGSWGSYVPVLWRFKPGVMVDDIRRPGYTETFGAKHRIGSLEYNTQRAKASPVEVRQTWYIPGKWSVASRVRMTNLTDEPDDGAAVAVAMSLQRLLENRNQLNWYADFHSGGKAGVPEVPRLSDEEYQRLVELHQFHVEYREEDRAIVACRGYDVRAEKPSNYFGCLMLGAPVKAHVLAADGNAQQSGLFAEGKEYPRQLTNPAAMIGLRSKSFRLGPHQSHELKYAIAFGKTADEAIENARNALAVAPEDAAARLDAYWDARLPALTTGDPGLTSMLRYAGITHDVNWEPDGRAPGDLGGWGRPSRAEVCGYKNYYDQADMVVPILDVPVYDSDLFKRALLYDVAPQTGRLRKLIVWRQQYDSMLYWPAAVYRVWMASQDDRFLEEIYPALDNTFRWLHKTRTNPDGLLRMLTMPYDMFTVGLGDDGQVLTKAQAVAYDSLHAMVRMARRLDKADDAAFYEQWAVRIKKASNEKLWRNRYYGFGLNFPDHLCLSGNLCAITAGLADEAQTAAICEEVSALYTGSGFPNVHPPLPRWVGSAPYGYQNGDMYIDQLALVARAANKARDTDLLRTVLFEFKRLVQRHKCFPVTGHPWDANRRGGVNEIHSASALIASLVYGVAGVEEQRSLRLRPMLIPEMGGSVQISDYLFRGTRFDIRLEGVGTHLQSILVDGKKQEKAVVPEEYYDGTKHTVTVRVKE